MAATYIFAGINHFVMPKFYLRIIPRYLPFHKTLNYLSGALEILLGALLLFPEYRSISARGIVALLIAIFPANVNHLTSAKSKKGIWLLYARIPFQGILIWWAWWYTG